MKREVIAFNQDWEFWLGGKEGAGKIVCLPHAVTLTPAISSGGRNYQGVCCYEKILRIEDTYAAGRVFLKLEGAMGESRLLVNQREAAVHTCGYTPLCADITDFVAFGKENRIEVWLDNSDCEDIPPGKAQQDLDYTYEGGLYRDSWLTFTSGLYITDPLVENETAGGGIFVWFSDVSAAKALVHARIQVANETGEDRNFDVKAVLTTDSKDIAARTAVAAKCRNGEKVYAELCMEIASPLLWSPEDPKLYRLDFSIEEEDILWDDMAVSVGIRDFVFTEDQGVIFNGTSRVMTGANYHQTYPYIGNAVPDSLLIRDILKLKEAGMEHIRGHYPFGEAFTDACDRLGMTLTVSLPGWQWFKEGLFAERCFENLRQIIRWQRNHPSVLIWEVLPNETEMPDWFQAELVRIAKEEYPYSPFYTASDYGPTDIAYREYDPGMLAPGMRSYGEAGQKRHMPLWVREYGDAPDNWTDQNCAWRVPRGWGDGAMVKAVERMLGLDPQFPTGGYADMCSRGFHICGHGVWPGIEHNRGYHINPCYGGYFDLFRIPKFTYEFIRSQLPPDKAGCRIFIANWWTEISPGDVTVFSNGDKVRLYYDGCLVEEREPEPIPVPHPPFVFCRVREQCKLRDRGMLTAEAIVNGKPAATAVVQSPGVPKCLKLSADFCGLPLKADGSDMVMVYCRLLDRDGNTVPLAGDRHPVLFEIEGEGEIVGDASIGANPVLPEGGIASVLIQSTKTAGKIILRARMFWEQRGPASVNADELVFESESR